MKDEAWQSSTWKCKTIPGVARQTRTGRGDRTRKYRTSEGMAGQGWT